MSGNDFWKHDTSLVSQYAIVGRGTKIWQFSNIMNDVQIGEDCNIGQNVFLENGVIIGNRVKIKNNVALYTGVVCEDEAFLGPSCVFTNVLTPRSFLEKKNQFKRTLIKKGASIGANATILCGVTIGEYALIGAGSVVTKDVPPYALIVGNPGKLNGFVCRCGERLVKAGEGYQCSVCGCSYIMRNERMEVVV